MKRSLLCIILCITILISSLSGCVNEDTNEEDLEPKDGDKKNIREKSLNGTYNPKLIYGKIYIDGEWVNYTHLGYTKDGFYYETAFIDYALHAFNWMKNNTDEDSTVLSWWDYGGTIEGYSEREAIAVYPPLSLLDTIAMYSSFNEEGKKRYIEENEWSDNDTIKEIATVLTTDNLSNETVQNIVDKYNVKYIFTRYYDKQLAGIFLSAAGKNPTDYFTPTENSNKYCYGGIPKDKANETLIYRMWEKNPDIPRLTFKYAKQNIRIFELK